MSRTLACLLVLTASACVATTMRPRECSIACAALLIRLSSTWLTCAGAHSTGGVRCPGARVDPDGLRADLGSLATAMARLQARDRVQDGAIQSWQDLGDRQLVHGATAWPASGAADSRHWYQSSPPFGPAVGARVSPPGASPLESRSRRTRRPPAAMPRPRAPRVRHVGPRGAQPGARSGRPGCPPRCNGRGPTPRSRPGTTCAGGNRCRMATCRSRRCTRRARTCSSISPRLPTANRPTRAWSDAIA